MQPTLPPILFLLFATLASAATVPAGYSDHLYAPGPVSTFGYGDIEFDAAGNMYAVFKGNTVWLSTAGSGTFTNLASVSGEGIALELDGNTLYVGDRSAGQVYTLDVSQAPPLTPQPFSTLSGAVTGLVRNCDGQFLVASTSNGVYTIDSAGTSTFVIAGQYSAVACTINDEIIVSEHSAGLLHEIQLPSSRTTFASGLTEPSRICVHPGTGNIYVAEEVRSAPTPTSGGTIEELDPLGNRLNDRFAVGIGWDWGWVPAPMSFNHDFTRLYYFWEDIPAFPPPTEVRYIDGFPPPIPPPTCMLALVGSSPVHDDVDLDLTPQSPAGASTVDATFEFSLDGGMTWTLATPSGSSANPLLGVPVGAVSPFAWDSRTDMVGIAALAPGALVRATVDDGMGVPAECTTLPFDIDNTSLCNQLCGDCDENTLGPNVLDALTGAQISAGLFAPSASQMACCDVDASASVTVLDALQMAQSAAGLGVVLTCP